MKLIAIDLDGTLLNTHHKISKENADAIRMAQRLGIEVTICTGRYYADVKALADEAGIKTHIISNNGSSICSKDGQTIDSFQLNRVDLKEILTWLEKNSYSYEIATDFNNIYLKDAFENLEKDFYTAKKIDSSLEESALHTVLGALRSQTNMMLLDSKEDILSLKDNLYNLQVVTFDKEKRKKGIEFCKSNGSFSVVTSSDFNFELVNNITSKGHALSVLGKYLNIDLTETMAIGDSFNDLSMLKKAKYSVAMGNAREEIKSICDFTTLKNNDNGVAHAINKYINKCNISI